MEQQTEIKTVVDIVREVVKGYYVLIYRETQSYKIMKYNLTEFISNFKKGDWVIDQDGDVVRFLMTSDTDPTTTDSYFINTFNNYKVDGGVRIAQLAVICDWSYYELAFNEKQPFEALQMMRAEKN